MTPLQDKEYWREWARVRRAIGDEATNDLRHDLHVRALGHDKSHKDFTNADFDKVLAEFYALSRPAGLDRQLAQLNQERRRLIWKIEHEQTALLGAFMADPGAYIAQILEERFHVRAVADLSHQPGRLWRSVKYSDSSPLAQLMMTLAARIDRLRRKAGWTVEEMRYEAGLIQHVPSRTQEEEVRS